MKTRMDKKLLIYTVLSGMAGILIGVLITTMTLAPAPEALRVLEHERLTQILKAKEAQDQEDMQGLCENGVMKSLRSGAIAACHGGKWIRPGIDSGCQMADAASPIPNTTQDKDGVIWLNPQNGCGPHAHVVADSQHGQLCVQNEGSWKTTAREEREPCLPLPGTPPGILDMCRYSTDGKIIGRSAQALAVQ